MMRNQYSQTEQVYTVDEQALLSALALSQAAASGDSNARNKVVELIYDRIWKTLSFMSSHKDEVEDLVQNALIEVLDSLDTFRGDCPLEYWAEKIAFRNSARFFKKHHRRRRIWETFVRQPMSQHDLAADVQMENQQLIQRFRRCLAQLSAEQRSAIVAHHINGYSMDEIASFLGCSVFTVKGRLRRGRRLLKKIALNDAVLCQWFENTIDSGGKS